MSYAATYSPEDNKLRLYSTTRLDSETYAGTPQERESFVRLQRIDVMFSII